MRLSENCVQATEKSAVRYGIRWKDNNLDPMLALKLSDIFAWAIDFYAIQKGDQFRVIYDELFGGFGLYRNWGYIRCAV